GRAQSLHRDCRDARAESCCRVCRSDRAAASGQVPARGNAGRSVSARFAGAGFRGSAGRADGTGRPSAGPNPRKKGGGKEVSGKALSIVICARAISSGLRRRERRNKLSTITANFAFGKTVKAVAAARL